MQPDLTESLRPEVLRLVEDAAGAEIISTTGLIETIGVAAEAMMNFSAIWRDQLHQAVNDYQQTFHDASVVSDPGALASILAGHMSRRIEHNAEGYAQWLEIVGREHRKLVDMHLAMTGLIFGQGVQRSQP